MNKTMKTRAQQLGVTNFPFIIKDSNGNETYYEDSTGFWFKAEYDENGRGIYTETTGGYWQKSEYDSNGNETYFDNSHGHWTKREFDANGNMIYMEYFGGLILNIRK